MGSYKEPVKDIIKLIKCLNEVAPDSHNNEDEDKTRALPLEMFTDQDQVTVFQEARIDEIIDEADTSIIQNEADEDPPNNIDKTIIDSTTENTTSRLPSIEPVFQYQEMDAIKVFNITPDNMPSNPFLLAFLLWVYKVQLSRNHYASLVETL